LCAESTPWIGWEAVGPELIDQAIGRDGVAGIGEQHREEEPLLWARDADHPVAVCNFERSEDPVPQHAPTIGR